MCIEQPGLSSESAKSFKSTGNGNKTIGSGRVVIGDGSVDDNIHTFRSVQEVADKELKRLIEILELMQR